MVNASFVRQLIQYIVKHSVTGKLFSGTNNCMRTNMNELIEDDLWMLAAEH